MKFTSKRAPIVAGAAAALLLTFSTAAVYPAFAQTNDPTPTPGASATPSASDSDSSTDQDTDKGSERGSSKGAGRIGGSSDELVAEALGITVDELDAAYLEAANAALDQAVAEELLTQTQADSLRERLESAGSNGFHLGGRGFNLFGSDTIDSEALLAEALGISADELQAAYDEAQAAAVTQAVADGELTQEQADILTARRALQEYWATQQQTYEEKVQAALDAGAITQAQADLLLANQASVGGGRGFGLGGDSGRSMMPGMGGRGADGGRGMDSGSGMRGGPNGSRSGSDSQETQPDDSSDVQSNSNFVLPSAGL